MEKTTLTRVGRISKISKIAIAVGFGVVICGAAMSPAFAGGGGHRGGDRHEAPRHGGGHDRGHDGGGYVAAAPNYYYAPAPNYYYAPEPEYYPSAPVYSAPPPSEGINLFFGIH
jgi:hypothetical protein